MYIYIYIYIYIYYILLLLILEVIVIAKPQNNANLKEVYELVSMWFGSLPRDFPDCPTK